MSEQEKTVEEQLAVLYKDLADTEVLYEIEKGKTEYYKTQAKETMVKMAVAYPKASAWIEDAKKECETLRFIEFPTGRRRNTPGTLTGTPRLIGAMQRRIVNSPIQGASADILHMGAYLYQMHFTRALLKFDRIPQETFLVPGGTEACVHDAVYMEPRYADFLISFHTMMWCTQYGVTQWYWENFGILQLVPPEMEADIFFDQAHAHTWDYTPQGLKQAIYNALVDQAKNGVLVEETPEEVLESVLQVYRDPAIGEWLWKTYPLFDDPFRLKCGWTEPGRTEDVTSMKLKDWLQAIDDYQLEKEA